MGTNPGYTTCNIVLPQLQNRVVLEMLDINPNFPGYIQLIGNCLQKKEYF
jgi:hypothetical protein